MPSSILSRSRRDSWPPTQVRLNPMLPAAMELSARDADEDPLNYFLTPAPGLEDPEGGDLGDMMDFDAGIEDPSHPREIVRSVSPSSLDGLDKTKRPVVAGSGGGRKSSPEPPELSDGMASPWDDDSDEDYIRFTPPTNKFGLPFSLRDFTLDGAKMKPRSFTAPVAGHTGSDAMLSPPPPITSRGAASRGRNPAAQGHSRGRSGPTPAGRRRPQHVWREPSPDVWSIEEETNEDLVDGQAGDHADVHMEGGINQHVEVPAAKPKKKVRFVLPVKE